MATSDVPQGVSTYPSSPAPKRTPVDGSLYTAGQGLVSVVNNPSPATLYSSLLCWPNVGQDARWLETPPPLAQGLLKEVGRADFEDYFARLSNLHHQFANARRQQSEDFARRRSVSNVTEGGAAQLRGEGLVQALQQVPSLYFEQDFNLGRAETFDEVVRGGGEEEIAATLEIQAGYLDVVETELLNEIAARSDSFFEAAESVQSLRFSMAETLEEIRSLRCGMASVNSGLCERARRVQLLSARRESLSEVSTMLQAIEEAVHSQEALQLLILGRDYGCALDLLDDLQSQCDAKDLSKLHCLRHLPENLAGSRSSIKDAIVVDFMEVMRWRQSQAVVRMAAAPVLDTCGIPDASLVASTRTDSGTDELMASSSSLLHCMNRTGALSGALSQAGSRSVDQLKSSLRSLLELLLPPLLSISVPDQGELEDIQSQSLSDQLTALKSAQFLDLMKACLAVGTACCQHYSSACAAIAKSAIEGKVTGHKNAIDKMGVDTLQMLVDTFHGRWAKMLVARARAEERMADVLLLVESTRSCMGVADKFGARPLPRLNNVLQSKCKTQLEVLHTSNISNIEQALDTEPWTIQEVKSDCQAMVDQLLSNPVSDTSWNNGKETERSIDIKEARPVLQVRGASFRLVGATGNLLLMLKDYLSFHDSYADLTNEIGRRSVELLSVFNARSCQMVLGAQAMKQSGLKSITAKHLALCSQSVLLLLSLHEAIHNHFLKDQAQARRSILEPEFDRLKQDLRIHLDGIHSKLVSILKERLLVGAKQFELASSDGPSAETEEGTPSPLLEQISRQLQTLSRVLIPLLLDSQIQDIFTEVAQVFSDVMTPIFKSLQSNPDWDKEQLDRWCRQWVVDCSFLVQALENLPLREDVLDRCLAGIRGVLACGPTVSAQVTGPVKPEEPNGPTGVEPIRPAGPSESTEPKPSGSAELEPSESTVLEPSGGRKLEICRIDLDAQPL